MTELDPERLLRTLAEHQVEFCVIGALAAWLQGNPSVTLDLDVMPQRELDNAERLAAALNELGAKPQGPSQGKLEGADFLGWQSQLFETDAGPLDVIPVAAAIGGFEDVATVELKLGEVSIRVLAIDEVIASKEELGRPKEGCPAGPLCNTRGIAPSKADLERRPADSSDLGSGASARGPRQGSGCPEDPPPERTSC